MSGGYDKKFRRTRDIVLRNYDYHCLYYFEAITI